MLVHSRSRSSGCSTTPSSAASSATMRGRACSTSSRGRPWRSRPFRSTGWRWRSSGVLTLDYDRLGVRPGDLVLDLGCGFGRHSYEVLRRGGRVVAVDLSHPELVK